ncbi:hypothetical protein N7495_006451, partial [Penicillium taxi]|uniref:uncharacterized protein n=1 Tax=Penicillium taxi TaxID=168475 RepID=UPI002545A259
SKSSHPQPLYSWLYNHTALAPPSYFDWLPKKEVPGFTGIERIQPSRCIMTQRRTRTISLISTPLRETLKDGKVSIKHVFLLKLESFRYDIFPLRKESQLGDVIRESYSNNKIPDDVERRLAGLTCNADRLSGTPCGFDTYANNFTARGGLDIRNVYTGDTFTLKSILASACGVAPLWLHHIYEPCMPQVFNVLSKMPSAPEKDANDYTT